jgi:methionyl-tRNA synthetase
MARILITSAIPYINGIKHLGNLVGSQLPADLYARFNRAMGHEVMFICATDEHGTPAELAAAIRCKRTWPPGSGCPSTISAGLPRSATIA